MIDIQEHWDKIIQEDKSPHWVADFCGCILPNQDDVLAGPNARRFILRPCDHSTKHHKTDLTTLPTRKRPAEQSAGAENTLGGRDGVLKTKLSCTSTAIDQSSGKKVKVTVKEIAVRFVQTNVASMLDPKVSLFEAPKDEDAEFAQDFCLSLILTGERKIFSKQGIIDTYETANEGVRLYYDRKFSKLEINNKVAPPPCVALNSHNSRLSRKVFWSLSKILKFLPSTSFRMNP